MALEKLYQDNFKPEEYLTTYYRSLDGEVEFFLRNLHHFFFVSNGISVKQGIYYIDLIVTLSKAACMEYLSLSPLRMQRIIIHGWLGAALYTPIDFVVDASFSRRLSQQRCTNNARPIWPIAIFTLKIFTNLVYPCLLRGFKSLDWTDEFILT